VFWLDNTNNWVYAILEKGFVYVTAYPDHLFIFLLTVAGLLALVGYTAYFAKKSFGTESLDQLDMRKVGAIITALGMYFLVTYVLWLLFGTVPKWSGWWAWFLGHNMDLWLLTIPFIGLPLLFTKRPTKEEST
jgi:hypothetical protein